MTISCHPSANFATLSTYITDEFRLGDEMRYQLMPYNYTQAKHCTETGLPMLRALFVEFPGDPGATIHITVA